MKPFFLGFRKNWLLNIEVAKMVTNGGLGIHLQKAPKLSKEWGEGQFSYFSFLEPCVSCNLEISNLICCG